MKVVVAIALSMMAHTAYGQDIKYPGDPCPAGYFTMERQIASGHAAGGSIGFDLRIVNGVGRYDQDATTTGTYKVCAPNDLFNVIEKPKAKVKK